MGHFRKPRVEVAACIVYRKQEECHFASCIVFNSLEVRDALTKQSYSHSSHEMSAFNCLFECTANVVITRVPYTCSQVNKYITVHTCTVLLL